SADSSMTCASTQPPMVTDPRMRPPSPTTILAPSFRGVVPRVLTKVATATLPSSCFSCSMWSKSSVMGSPSSSAKRQVAREIAQAGEVVSGGKVVDQRQCGGHAARERFVGRVAEERVEPHDLAGQALEREHLLGQHLGLPGVPSVREQEHD